MGAPDSSALTGFGYPRGDKSERKRRWVASRCIGESLMTYAKSYIEFRGTSRREFFGKKARQTEDNLGESRGRDGGKA